MSEKNKGGRPWIDPAHNTKIIGYKDTAVKKQRLEAISKRMGINTSELLRVIVDTWLDAHTLKGG